MCLSRFKPADWNKFLDVVLKWDNYNNNFKCLNIDVYIEL